MLKDCLPFYGRYRPFRFRDGIPARWEVASFDSTPHKKGGEPGYPDAQRWQAEIERGLATMDAMVAILTPGFRDSVWTNQEIGFALGRGAKIISLRMGEDPPGFISAEQAIPQQQRMAVDIAPVIVGLLSDDERTTMRMAEAMRLNSVHGDVLDGTT